MPRIEFENGDNFYRWLVGNEKPFSVYLISRELKIAVLQTVSTPPVLYGVLHANDAEKYKKISEKICGLNLPVYEASNIEWAADRMGRS